MAELHSALRVAVQRTGTIPRWPSRLIADSVPRRLAVALFRLKSIVTAVTKWSESKIILYSDGGVRSASGWFECGTSGPSTYDHGTVEHFNWHDDAVPHSGCLLALRRPVTGRSRGRLRSDRVAGCTAA